MYAQSVHARMQQVVLGKREKHKHRVKVILFVFVFCFIFETGSLVAQSGLQLSM